MPELITLPLADLLSQYKDCVKIKSQDNYRLVTISNTGNIYLRGKKKGTEIKATKLYKISAGSFIYSRLAAHTGSFGIIPHELDGAMVSNEMPVFDINMKVILPDYFLYLLSQKNFLYKLLQLTKGMGRVRIKENLFLSQKIWIHKTIAQQKNILNRLNLKTSYISELNLESSQQKFLLRKLRQQILQDAIEGKLTAVWRKKNPRLIRGENHALKLLEQIKIKKEREKLFKRGKIRKEKLLPPIDDEKKNFTSPNGWAWCRFGDYALVERGRFSVRPRNDKSCYGGRYPFIQIGSLNAAGDTITEYKQTLNEKGFSASKQFEKNTIAIAIVGGTIGNLGVLGLNMCFPDSMIGIRPQSNTNQDYILLLLRSKQAEIKKASYQMAGQPNIKIPTLTDMIIPLPPLLEQQVIVERVDKIMAVVDELEKQIIERKEQSEMLLQSVLREAFSTPKNVKIGLEV